MSKPYVAALAGLLVGAALALGQTPDARPVPASEAKPVVASDADLKPIWSPLDEIRACFGMEPGAGGPALVTVDAEYVMWFLANARNSVMTGTTATLSQQGANVLNALGDAEHGKGEPISGARLSIACWDLEDNPWVRGGIRDLGLEARFFFVGSRSVNFHNDAVPTIVRPFFDLNNRMESGFVVANPGEVTGTISAQAKISDLWGGELNLWKCVYHDRVGTTCGISLMGGFRYLSVDTGLQINSTSQFNPNLPSTSAFLPLGLAGNTLVVQDNFTAHNRFYGGQGGIAGHLWLTPTLMCQASLKYALGYTNETLNINGSQVRTFANGQTQTFSAGVLALPSNSGSFNQNRFAQVPETEVRVSSRITDNVTLTGALTALYWNRIIRSASQIDREVDITQIPNFPIPAGSLPANVGHPSVPFKQGDLWVLGLSLGLEIVW
jgi:hypothetical protein